MIAKGITVPLLELTILPYGGWPALYRVSGNELEFVQKLDFLYKHKHVIGGNRWIIAILENYNSYPNMLDKKKSNTCMIYRAKINDDGSLTRLKDISLPSHYLNQTLAIKGDVIYLGGHRMVKKGLNNDDEVNVGEMAGYMDLTLEEPKWHPLPLPIEMQAGKSIDDVLVYEDKLILVDNIMYPKYLFEYDITDPLNPVASKTINLPNNGTYEHIHRGSNNNEWMALLSGGVGRGGSRQYISVFNLPNYEQFLTISLDTSTDEDFFNSGSFSTLEEEFEKARNKVNLHDFAISGNKLYVACGLHGVAVFQLTEELKSYNETNRKMAEHNPDFYNPRFKYGSSYSLNRINKMDENRVKVAGIEDARVLVQLADGRVVVVGCGENLNEQKFYILEQ